MPSPISARAMLTQASRWLAVSMALCAAVHAAACARLLFGQQIATGVLFGCQSLGCLAFVVYHVWLVFCSCSPPPSTVAGGTPPGGKDVTPQSPQSPQSPQQTSMSLDFSKMQSSFPVERSASAVTGFDEPHAHHRWAWLLLLAVGPADLLWAWHGARSFWFLVLLPSLPKELCGPMAALAVGLVACSALLCASHALNLPGGAGWAGLFPVVVFDTSCALLPSLLLLVQLVSAHFEGKRRCQVPGELCGCQENCCRVKLCLGNRQKSPAITSISKRDQVEGGTNDASCRTDELRAGNV